jgi:hypothetical protein
MTIWIGIPESQISARMRTKEYVARLLLVLGTEATTRWSSHTERARRPRGVYKWP